MSQGDAGAARNPENPSGCEQAPTRGDFSVFLRRASPPGGGPWPPCPGVGIAIKQASCCVRSIAAKRNLFPVTLANRFADSDTNGNKASCRVRNMGNITVTEYESHEEHPRRPRARRRYAASPDTLAYPGKRQGNRAGESLLSLRQVPCLFKVSWGRLAATYPNVTAAHKFEFRANLVPQPRVQGDHPPGSGVWGPNRPPRRSGG